MTKEKLSEYPSFDKSITANNVAVYATAQEGVLPLGAQLVAKQVTRKAILNAVKEKVEKDKTPMAEKFYALINLISKRHKSEDEDEEDETEGQYTIWMVVLGIVQIVVFFVGRKWKNVDNVEDHA